jgi:hypothetical protein
MDDRNAGHWLAADGQWKVTSNSQAALVAPACWAARGWLVAQQSSRAAC